jgi:long-chain acyl-CoA synthetase
MEEETAVELSSVSSALTIPALLTQRVAAHGSETILRKKDRGIWKATTWSELDARVRPIGRGLLAAGLGPGDCAAFIADTRPEAVYADLAILGAGGASVAIHPEEEAHRVGHILRATGCRFIFVENEEQLDKILTIKADCPALAYIVIIDMKGLRDFSDPQCESLDAFCARQPPGGDAWEAAMAAVAPDQPALVVFPRGELAGTGRTLTHNDVMHLVANARDRLGVRAGDERLAVLPMADVMEHVLGLYLSLDARIIGNYLESPETATENLQQVQPTVFGADAEAWERLCGRITAAANAATPLQRLLYRWALGAGRLGGPLRSLADLLVLRAVRRELGLNRLRIAYIGATPVSPAVEDWTRALGITIVRIGGVPVPGEMVDGRYQALMDRAYCAG